MTRLESISLTRSYCTVNNGKVHWLPHDDRPTDDIPQICWTTGLPWREANLWFFERWSSKDVSLTTVQTQAASLLAYARWLEETSTDWWNFPPRKADRCLVRYRGALCKLRDDGAISPSVATARMRTTIAFYSWMRATGLLSSVWPMWSEKLIGIRLTDSIGFERTITVRTTDLAIPNRKRNQDQLEDGVWPVSAEVQKAVLLLARDECSVELALMLSLGFFTGLRLGSICDLKVETIEHATPDPLDSGRFWLSVGPGACPPVATKFGVTGQVLIPAALRSALLEYCYSVRRLKRQARASVADRSLAFLTRFGNPYAKRGAEKSPSVNVEMHRLRSLARAAAITIGDFNFHQTRATFATAVADMAIKTAGAINAIALVKDLLLHKHEATSLRYIKFIQKASIKKELANEFTRLFLGLRAPVQEA